MSQSVATPPADCPGLLEVDDVPGRAGEGSGYTFQICRRTTSQGNPARHVVPFPDDRPHVVVLHRPEEPPLGELQDIARALDDDPGANESIR